MRIETNVLIQTAKQNSGVILSVQKLLSSIEEKMKKILTIALVALLAASSVFAGLSGKATISLGYDTESKSYGFVNGKGFSLDLDLASETAENVGEGDVYAGVKATMGLKVANRRGTNGSIYANNGNIGLGVLFSLKEAYVAGADWKVAITGTQSGPDFAASAIDTEFDDWSKDSFGNKSKTPDYASFVAKSYSVSVNKAPGFTATYKDWKVALGFEGGKADEKTGTPDYFNYHASVFTPSIVLADGLTVKAAAVASGIKNATDTTKTTNYISGQVVESVSVYNASKNFDAFGGSLELAYASDTFSGKLAADFGMEKTVGTDKFVPGLDVAANAVISGFTVDVYYQYKNWISAQVKADLNTFEIPVVLTVYGKNLADKNEGQELGGKAEATLSAFTVSAGGSYALSSKKLALSGAVEYKAEKFKAGAGMNFSKVLTEDGAKQLYANASIESDTLVPGATLTLAYGPNYGATDRQYYETTNFLDANANKGTVEAKCTIKF